MKQPIIHGFEWKKIKDENPSGDTLVAKGPILTFFNLLGDLKVPFFPVKLIYLRYTHKII